MPKDMGVFYDHGPYGAAVPEMNVGAYNVISFGIKNKANGVYSYSPTYPRTLDAYRDFARLQRIACLKAFSMGNCTLDP